MAENLATFLAVTGCEDEASAKFFLESANNDVEQAINMYMEQGGAAAVVEGAAAQDTAEDDPPEPNFSVGMAGGAEEQRFAPAMSRSHGRMHLHHDPESSGACGVSVMCYIAAVAR